MMKKVDLMIFDFDGTLVSSNTDLAQAINFTLNALDLKGRPEEEIISFVGDGINHLIEKALGQDHIQYREKAILIFSDYYTKHLLDNTRLCPHAEDVLKNFKDKLKVILTNKRFKFTLAIAQGLNIQNYFTEIIGADSTPYQKPDRRLIDYLLNKYGIAKKNTVIIGDGVNDIAIAKNSGIMSCVYLNGLGKRQDLLSLKAEYYCDDLSAINLLFY
jgi:haloacid dehalogenase superfamily, subfamily IA, variant 1 with third motif having Dx(3-4)D or Dx(3-4)E